MASAEASSSSYNGRTAWARNLAAPVRDFLSTETGGAIVLLAATVAALRLGELALVALLRVGLDDEAVDHARRQRDRRPTCATGSTRA